LFAKLKVSAEDSYALFSTKLEPDTSRTQVTDPCYDKIYIKQSLTDICTSNQRICVFYAETLYYDLSPFFNNAEYENFYTHRLLAV
jgi:hypothetical protein